MEAAKAIAVAAADCFPLADRMPGRVHLLRAAGDSIVPPLAAEFIKAYCEIAQARLVEPQE